jgi:glycosyltransferase involved in cell wall biosynthesis
VKHGIGQTREDARPGFFSIGRPLRIAQIAPLYESVPPRLYGGTERIVAYLVEELARRGHQVTLFAAGDSTVNVPLWAGVPKSLRLSGLDHLGAVFHLPMLSDIYEQATRFDIIHSHVDCLSFPLARFASVPTVSTMHGRLDVKELLPVYRHYKDQPVISISHDQRRPLPEMNWVGTVYHGLPRNLLKFRSEPGDYLAFLGRLSPEKRPDLAIEIARRSGIPLKIAAKIDRSDREYFETVIRPLLSTPGVEFIGEINETQKQEFLGRALALLFPVDWPEPFGLVMIEALACGTPVIARPCGSVPEVLRHGISGFIESSIDELVDAVQKVRDIPRRTCRAEFERRFTAEVMADNYEQVYYQLSDMRRVTQGAAVRPKRAIHDVALAREATRQWHRATDADGLNTRPESEAPVLKLFSNREDRDSTNLDS